MLCLYGSRLSHLLRPCTLPHVLLLVAALSDFATEPHALSDDYWATCPALLYADLETRPCHTARCLLHDGRQQLEQLSLWHLHVNLMHHIHQ